MLKYLKQNEGFLPVEEQVAIIYCGSTGILSNVPVKQNSRF